jgi:hypothetical protein
MMAFRLLPFLAGYLGIPLLSAGQVLTTCVTALNQQQVLTTTCSTQYSASAVQQIFKGTPFFNYPNWQAGSIQLNGQQRPLTGEVAYDLVDNQVYYRLDSANSDRVRPNVFFINQVKFLGESTLFMGKPFTAYYEVLYDGTTKLLKRTTRKVVLQEDRQEGYNGYYQEQTAYFIKRRAGKLMSINLTRRSTEKVLAAELKRSGQTLPAGDVSVETLVSLLRTSEVE